MQTRSALLKQQIESALATRIPAALSPLPSQSPRLLATGIPELDAALGGGLPIGGVSEFTGAAGSGRTCLAYAVLREASRVSACAYIDVSDSLDPQSAAASGVMLQNLLWVRVTDDSAVIPGPRSRAVRTRNLDPVPPPEKVIPQQRGFGAHPRTETRGIDQALEKILRDKAEARYRKAEGTPGYPNQKLGRVSTSLAGVNKDQVDYEQFNARRADETDPRRQSDQRAAMLARERARSCASPPATRQFEAKPWDRLDKSLRAADQVLQSGGFRVVVLDMASVLPEHALRIPLATWFRMRRAAQESDAVVLLLTAQACARSSAACVIECSQTAGPSANHVLVETLHVADIARQRAATDIGKKPPGRAIVWKATAPWMRAVGR